MAKRSQLMKMVAVSIVLLFLVSGFSVMAYGSLNSNHNANENLKKVLNYSSLSDPNFEVINLTNWNYITSISSNGNLLILTGASLSGNPTFGIIYNQNYTFIDRSSLLPGYVQNLVTSSYGDRIFLIGGGTFSNPVLLEYNSSGSIIDLSSSLVSNNNNFGSVNSIAFGDNIYLIGGAGNVWSPISFFYPVSDQFESLTNNIPYYFATNHNLWNGNNFIMVGAKAGWGGSPGTPPAMGLVYTNGSFEDLSNILPSYVGVMGEIAYNGYTYLVTAENSSNGAQIIFSFNLTSGEFSYLTNLFPAGLNINTITNYQNNFLIGGNFNSNKPYLAEYFPSNQTILNLTYTIPSYIKNINDIIEQNNTLIIAGQTLNNNAILLLNKNNYLVTFTESGLPSGTSWSITLNGTTKSSTTNTITFSVPNGTYSYVVESVSGYTASPSSGTITVNGANIEKAVTFTPSNIYTMSFGVLYKGSQYTINLNVSSTDLKNALSLNSLPDELTLSNISKYILDFEWHPNSYSIYSVRLISQNGSPVTNKTTEETILYQTLVWAMLYNEISLLQSTYGSQSTSYSNLINLQQTQWVQEAGIDLSDFVNYATLVGPILGELSIYFGSSSTDIKLANMAIHAIFDLLKGYESLKNNFPQGAPSILYTLEQYGLISSTNPSEYNPEIFVANLAQLNPNEYNSLVLAIYSDLGVQSTQVPFSVVNLGVKILENLGENALSAGISAATSSAVTFLEAYYGAQFSLEAASTAANIAAIESISDSVSDFLAFMLPLSIANAIYSSYLEPMSSYLEQMVNAQDLMYNTLYPLIMNTLNSFSEGNYANVTDAILSMTLIGFITNEWYTWYNASIAELKGEFLNFNANQQIQTAEQIQSSLFNNEREIYFAMKNASIMADSLINGQQPTLHVSPGFYYIIPSNRLSFNQIELALGQEWQQFTNAMSSAAQYAENAWSNLTSGISDMSATFSYYMFGKDTPEFIVIMDNFTVEQEAGFLKSTYPLSSVIYGNNSVILVLPGNLSGYVSIAVDGSVEVNVTYYNESSPQTTGVLASFNAESGNAYIMYISSNSAGKKALVAGYSLSFINSEYRNVPWEVKISSSNGNIVSEVESNSSEITFNDLPNGTYIFSLSPLNNTYRATPMNGEVSINGYNQIEQITFSLVKPQQTTNYLSIGIIGAIIVIVILLGVAFLIRNRNKKKGNEAERTNLKKVKSFFSLFRYF